MVICVTTFPVLAVMPPSMSVSSVLPVEPRATRPIFIDMGGIDPTVTLYAAELPTATLARSTASGVGGP